MYGLRVAVIVGILGMAPSASAAVSVIYRRADRQVCGYVHPPHSAQQEIVNCTQSAMGGQIEDYAVASIPTIAVGAEKAVIAEDGTATVKPVEPTSGQEEQDIPFDDIANSVGGGLAVLAGQGLLLKLRKKKETPA